MGTASVKVEDGKLVKIETGDYGVRLSGDFFIQPPEARSGIEDSLENLENISEDTVVDAVEKTGAELIGFSAETVAEAYMEALDG